MKYSFAIVLLVVIVGLVECKQKAALKARMLAKIADHNAEKAKRGGDDTDWPYGWMEYASLVGKCEAALNWLEFLEIDVPNDSDDECGILADACPKALALGEQLLDASDECMEEATQFMRNIFGLLQCVNLQAAREELEVVLDLNEKDEKDDTFLQEAAPLFNMCEDVFASFEDQEQQFEKYMAELTASSGTKRETSYRALLDKLLKANRRK